MSLFNKLETKLFWFLWNRPIAKPLRDKIAEDFQRLTRAVGQVEFLLKQAPLIDFPAEGVRQRAIIQAARANYAYINTDSIASYLVPGHGQWVKFGGSPTKWVLTAFLPVGVVIFSPNEIPGLEKIAAG